MKVKDFFQLYRGKMLFTVYEVYKEDFEIWESKRKENCKCGLEVNYLFNMPSESDAVEFIKDRDMLFWEVKDNKVFVYIDKENIPETTPDNGEVSNE